MIAISLIYTNVVYSFYQKKSKNTFFMENNVNVTGTIYYN